MSRNVRHCPATPHGKKIAKEKANVCFGPPKSIAIKDNNKNVGDVITTRIHEVLKTGVKVHIDKEKKLITTIRKIDLAKASADARPEVFSPGNALDAKITELDYKTRRIKLSVKAAQIDEEKSLIAKFGEGATKSGATLKGIFEKAIGKKNKKEK